MKRITGSRPGCSGGSMRIRRPAVFLLALCVWGGSARAQVPGWDWAVTAGGGGSDAGYDIAINSSGEVYVAGYQESATFAGGTGQETTVTVSGGFLAKYDADGGLIWVKPVSGGRIMSLALDSNEHPVVAGFFAGTVVFGPGEPVSVTLSALPDNEDRFLAKYSTGGVLQWAVKPAKIFSYDHTEDISVDSRDYITVAGMSYESPSDMYSVVQQYNAYGTYIWGESANTVNSAVTCDALNNSYVAGVKGKMNVQDMAVAKYSDSGTKLWATETSGSGSIQVAQPKSILVDAGGNIYVSGLFFGTVTFGPGETHETTLTVSGYTPFLAKYANSGSLQWVRQTQGEVIALDPAGFLYAASYTVLQKFDLNGTALWTKTDAAGAGGTVQAMDAGANGLPCLTGTYTASVSFDPGTPGALTLTAEGGNDIYVAKLSSFNPTVSGVVFFYPSHTMIQGAVITFSGLGTATTNAGGYYAKEVPAGWSGTLTPSVTGLDFDTLSYSLTNVVSDVLYRDFWIIGDPVLPISGRIYSDGGAAPLAGVSVSASGGTGTTVSDGAGFYMLSVPYTWTGTVTPSHGSYAFSPASRSYTGITHGYLDQDYTVPGTEVSDNEQQPQRTVLYANYPNPFNHSTVIRFELRKEQSIRLDIYSAAGRLVRTLHCGEESAGCHEIVWNGCDDGGTILPSGIYFCRLSGRDEVQQIKLLFIK
ncbi:T9SS type A sorting domain-containing protein [bacterium]|nr:T9SS type A sorting domain-containing protein [bacterium]